MKNTILICLSLFAVSTLSGCLKKADDDPFISLRSRKGRVDGDWKVVSIKETRNFTPAGNQSSKFTSVFTSDGTAYTLVTTTNGIPTTDTGKASQKWKFDKEGKYEESTVTDGTETKSSGRWNFTSGVGETKNKSHLALSEETNTASQTTYTGTDIQHVYEIKELRHKKMVLYYHTTVTDGSGYSEVESETELESE